MENKNPEYLKYYSTLPDGGPLYTETDLSNVIVEPWNAISSLAFLIPAAYWFFRLYKNPKENWFLLYCSVLLLFGGLGSTLFHGFRIHRFFIVMDFLPMAIATFSLTIFFWYKLLKKWYLVLSIVPPAFALRYFLFEGLGHHNSINASYFLSGTLFFLPLLLLLNKSQWSNWRMAFAGLASFVIALYFRQIDAWDPPVFSIGTHFIWHLAGAAGCHFLASYVYSQHPNIPVVKEEGIIS